MKTLIKTFIFFTTILILTSCSQDDHMENIDEVQLQQNKDQEFEEQRMPSLPYNIVVTIPQSSCGNDDVSVPFSAITRSECENLYLRWTHAELYPYYLLGNWDIKIHLKWRDSSSQVYNEVFDLNAHFDYYADDYPFVPSTIGQWYFSNFSVGLPTKFKFRIKMTNTTTGCTVTSDVEQYTLPPCN